MSTTITHPGGTITPTAVDGYEASLETGNIVHPILGASSPDVTFRDAQLRTGTLNMIFDSAAELAAAVTAHATQAEPFDIENTDHGYIAMSYVCSGQISPGLDATRKAWTLAVDFQEVTT